MYENEVPTEPVLTDRSAAFSTLNEGELQFLPLIFLSSAEMPDLFKLSQDKKQFKVVQLYSG